MTDHSKAGVVVLALGALMAVGGRAETVDLATIGGDTLVVESPSSGTDYTNSSATAKTLVFTNITANATYSGTISGTIRLEVFVTADKKLTLSGENSFTEGLRVNLGTVRVTRPEALGSGTVTLRTGVASKLAFGASMTVSNDIDLNAYDKAGFVPTLTVEDNCQVVLKGLVKSDLSWVSVASGAKLTFAGGMEVVDTTLLCKTAGGVIAFAETPIDVTTEESLRIVGSYAYSSAQRVDIDVPGNDVSTISLEGRGCLRLNTDDAFDNAPDVTIPCDGRGLSRNGGYIDLNGHSQDFGTVTFASGAVQNSFVVCNASATPGVFAFNQASDESHAFVETDGPLDFVKKGTASFTVTNATFSVAGCVEVAAGTLAFTGVDGTRLADAVCVWPGATLDLGGHAVTCGTFLNRGGAVVNGTLTAATNRIVAKAGTAVTFADADLAVYYPLDRADRLCVDQSFHGNADLLPRGSPACVADAKFGKALSLDGSSALTNSVFPATLPTGSQAWSTCIFLKLRSTAKKKQHPVGWGSCSVSKANFLQLVSNGDTTFNHIVWSDTALSGKLPSGNFRDGWHSLVLTYEPTTNVRTMYFDGSSVASATVNRDGASRTPAVAAQDFALGGQHNSEADWNGWLDEAAVFRRALTADEVATYHATGVAGLASCSAAASCDSLEAGEGATLKIAQLQTTAKLVGPGTVETWGLTVTKEIVGCPTVVGDVTLAEGVAFPVASLSATEAVPLLRVSGGELTGTDGIRLIVNGVVCDPAMTRTFVRDGVLYGRLRAGAIVLLR